MNEQHILVNGLRLFVREYPAEGPCIVFLHFGGGNTVMWEDVVPFFKDNYRLLLLDLKGHGNSDKPKQGYHIDTLASEVLGVMDALKVSGAHVVGSSLGAEVGVSLAANYPNRILSLVCDGALFNQSGPYGLWEGSEEAFMAHTEAVLEKLNTTPPSSFSSIEALVKASQSAFEEMGWWNPLVEKLKRRDATRLADGRFVSSWSIAAPDYTKHYFSTRFEEYYSRIKCPVLMMPDTEPGQDEQEKQVMHALCAFATQGEIALLDRWIHPYGWMLMPALGATTVLHFITGQQ